MSTKYSAKFSTTVTEARSKSSVRATVDQTVLDSTKLDTEYVKEHLGRPLVLGLAQICLKKPCDPIEFLAHWLYKYRENELADVERQKNEELRLLEIGLLRGEEIGTV